MTEIEVAIITEDDDGWTVRVTVREGASRTTHRVSVPRDYYQQLTGGRELPTALVRRSFVFLLAREPKEAILRRFALPVIEQYFPGFETEIGR